MEASSLSILATGYLSTPKFWSAIRTPNPKSILECTPILNQSYFWSVDFSTPISTPLKLRDWGMECHIQLHFIHFNPYHTPHSNPIQIVSGVKNGLSQKCAFHYLECCPLECYRSLHINLRSTLQWMECNSNPAFQNGLEFWSDALHGVPIQIACLATYIDCMLGTCLHACTP